MPSRSPKATADEFPPFPLTVDHWQRIVDALEFSPQQARIVELVLRGLCDKQIAAVMGIGEPTIRTYLSRIFARTETHGRMQLALRVLDISHQVVEHDKRRQK
jgi:DNA-binding NarL/FixJ family response regulator